MEQQSDTAISDTRVKLCFLLNFFQPIGISRSQLRAGKKIKARIADAKAAMKDIGELASAIDDAQRFTQKHVGDSSLEQLTERYTQ